MERYDYWAKLGFFLEWKPTSVSKMHLLEPRDQMEHHKSLVNYLQWGKTINPTTASATWWQNWQIAGSHKPGLKYDKEWDVHPKQLIMNEP